MDRRPIMQDIDFLLVGQDHEALGRMENLFRKAGYPGVQVADGGVAARNVLITKRVHFVIAELDMPHMNGLELLKFVRRIPHLADIPVLLISNVRNKELVFQAIEELVDGYLADPYSNEDLLCAVIKIQQKRKHLSAVQKEIRQARHFFLRRRYDAAIEAAKRILARDKDNSNALYIISESYYRLRDLDRAKQFLKALLSKNASSSKVLHLLSKVCRLDGECGDAFSYLSKATMQNQHDLELKIDLGKFYLEMGQEEKAREIFESVRAREPTDLNLIKIGKTFLKKNQTEEAGRYLDSAVQPLPETAYVFARYAEQLGDAGKNQESAAQYEKCLQLIPDHPDYQLSLSRSYIKQGKREEARKILEQCRSRHPHMTEAEDLLASLG